MREAPLTVPIQQKTMQKLLRNAVNTRRSTAATASQAIMLCALMNISVFAAAKVGELSVMTFNIKTAAVEIGFDQHTSWDYIWNNDNDRRARVVALIDASDADIIGVQEMRGGQLDYLDDRLPSYAYYGVSRDTGTTSGNGERVGIFFNKTRFQLLSSGEFWLSETPDVPGTTFYGNGGDLNNPRMATWVTLHDHSLDRSYFVLNTHWALDSAARRQSALLIREKVLELSDGLPVIVMGDLNETAAGQAYAALIRPQNPGEFALANAYAASGAASGKTFHGYEGGVAGNPIDFVFGTSTHFAGIAGEINRSTFGGYYPSDHYPVQVTLDVFADRITGDYNGDGVVNGVDFLVWQRSYGATVPAGTGADGNGDSRVTAVDLILWQTSMNSASTAKLRSVAVPEPGVGLLSLAATCTTFASHVMRWPYHRACRRVGAVGGTAIAQNVTSLSVSCTL